MNENLMEVLLFNKEAILHCLKNRPKAIRSIFYTGKIRFDKEFIELLETMNLGNELMPKEFAQKFPNIKDTEVVAITERPLPSKVKPIMRDEWAENDEKIIFVDSIRDIYEIAQIARLSAYNDISRIVFSENTLSEWMSSDVWSLAKGAMEYVKIYTTESMSSNVRMMSDKFFIIGATCEGGRNFNYERPVVFPGKKVAFYIGGKDGRPPKEMISHFGHLLHFSSKNPQFFYSPVEIAIHFLPWVFLKVKKPGVGFLQRKKMKKNEKNKESF